MAGWYGLEKILKEVGYTKVEMPMIFMPQNIELDFSEAQNHRADIFVRMENNRIRANKMANLDRQIEIVKVIQRIFDNCSETEIHVGGNCYDSKLELLNICKGIEQTLEDLVNEKLRVEKDVV